MKIPAYLPSDSHFLPTASSGLLPSLGPGLLPLKRQLPCPHMVLGSPSLPHPTELGIQTGPRSSFRKAWLPPASHLPLTLIFTQRHLGYIPGIQRVTSHLLLRPQLPNYFPSANPTCIYKERGSEGLSGWSRIAQQTPRKSGSKTGTVLSKVFPTLSIIEKTSKGYLQMKFERDKKSERLQLKEIKNSSWEHPTEKTKRCF